MDYRGRRDGIEVPVFGEDAKSFDDIEYLFWVGCAGAFDDDGKRTTAPSSSCSTQQV